MHRNQQQTQKHQIQKNQRQQQHTPFKKHRNHQQTKISNIKNHKSRLNKSHKDAPKSATDAKSEKILKVKT